jgi:hypothetical protein
MNGLHRRQKISIHPFRQTGVAWYFVASVGGWHQS